jgi:hypothetical protein
MNSSTITSELIDRVQVYRDSASNSKRKSYENSNSKSFDINRLAAATVAIVFAVSPMTVLPDPWLYEKRQRTAVITSSIYEDIIGKLISRTEALRIVRKILEKAEEERIAIYAWEASREIQWSDSE